MFLILRDDYIKDKPFLSLKITLCMNFHLTAVFESRRADRGTDFIIKLVLKHFYGGCLFLTSSACWIQAVLNSIVSVFSVQNTRRKIKCVIYKTLKWILHSIVILHWKQGNLCIWISYAACPSSLIRKLWLDWLIRKLMPVILNQRNLIISGIRLTFLPRIYATRTSWWLWCIDILSFDVFPHLCSGRGTYNL